MRSRLASAATMLAFGLGVAMAGSNGYGAHGPRGWATPIAVALVLPPPRRVPLGAAPTAPAEPLRHSVPTGPAPGVRVSRVPLPPLPHTVAGLPPSSRSVVAVVLAAMLVGIAAITSVESESWCGFTWVKCPERLVMTPQLVAALVVLAASLLLLAIRLLRPNSGPGA